MSYSKIRPRGDLKANWESANPILSAREIGVEWETKIGVGDAKIKFGDGVTAWKNLDYAVVNNITKKIITTFATVSDADPALNAGESLDTILGKIKKKFQYLADNKLNKSAKYDGVDSTSTDLYATANAVRKVNVKADKNASDITTLNNNLSKLSNFKKVIADDTSATDIEDLLKKKCKLIKDSGLGVGFYAVIGGWSGHNYGLTIGESMSGMIRIAYFDLNDIYQASCNASDLNNFSYKKVPNSTELDKKATITDLELYAKKTDLSASQDNSYIVTKQNTIDKTLFSNAQFKARRPVNGTGAAAYSFENVGVNSGALYLDPSDYKLHFINYDGKKFIINWTAES